MPVAGPARPRPRRSPVSTLAVLLLAGCAGSDRTAPAAAPAGGGITVPPVPAPDLAGRGALVSRVAGPRVPRAATGAVLVVTGASRAFSARHDAQPWVVRYRTPGVDGRLTTASGAVWLPVGATGPRPVVVYLHGTITDESRAPSNLLQTPEGDAVGSIHAADGAVVVMPDYLGLGVAGGDSWHPYLHLQTQSSAAVDLLRAARALAAERGVALDPRGVFVTGYSQGGGAAMGLARELERTHAAELPLLGAAPMSGPYDLSGTAREMLERDDDYHAAAVYTAYLVGTLNRVYRIAPTLGDLLAAPHDRTADALVDGTSTRAQLASLPSRPRQVLRADVAAAMLADRDHPLWLAMRDNDAYDWTPRAPLRLYYGGADRDVPPRNALTAQARMRANGARDVAAVSVGASLDHAGAVLPATIAAKLFADSLRRVAAGAR